MPKLTVSRAETWEQVEVAAEVANACIKPTRGNWAKAKATFEIYHAMGDVQYWLIKNGATADASGYLRLLRLSPGTTRVTLLADYVTPSLYLPVLLAAKNNPQATVVAKVFGPDDEYIAEKWPRLTMNTASLERYPYSNTSMGLHEFRVVLT